MSKKDKYDLVIISILARITDFQLQSNDEKFNDWIEELREYIVNFNKGSK